MESGDSQPIVPKCCSSAGVGQTNILYKEHSLDNDNVARYSRQLILPEIGVKGAGGLGCPSSVYLVAAGIGHIGIVDHDVVELNNLHRQILHQETKVGQPKVDSASQALSSINTRLKCTKYNTQLSSENALDIVSQFDLVLDCSDNVATRYLVNDACVLAGKPLVSGSAVRFEGQLTVYNHSNGPCYRCLYPSPPPPETVNNCADAGVLGVVPGIIGCIQALEAIKIIVGLECSYSQRMLVFDALDGSFRNIKLRPRQLGCAVCGDDPTVRELIDYQLFCGSGVCDKIPDKHVLQDSDRISVQDYKQIIDSQTAHVLVDVREEVELNICHLPNSFYLPMSRLDDETLITALRSLVDKVNVPGPKTEDGCLPVYVLCLRGNRSQDAVVFLKEKLKDKNIKLQDIRGGLKAWKKDVDSLIPEY